MSESISRYIPISTPPAVEPAMIERRALGRSFFFSSRGAIVLYVFGEEWFPQVYFYALGYLSLRARSVT